MRGIGARPSRSNRPGALNCSCLPSWPGFVGEPGLGRRASGGGGKLLGPFELEAMIERLLPSFHGIP